jgi:hypothetical protein
MDCDDFDDLTLTTLSDSDSDFYKAPNDSLNFVLKVRRTHIVENGGTTPAFSVTDESSFFNYMGPKTTTGGTNPNISGGYNSGTSPTAFNNLTAGQFQAAVMPSFNIPQPTVDTYYALHGYYSTTTQSLSWVEIGATSPARPVDVGQLFNSCSVVNASAMNNTQTAQFTNEVIAVSSRIPVQVPNPAARYLVFLQDSNPAASANVFIDYFSPTLQCSNSTTIINKLNSDIANNVSGAPTFTNGQTIRITTYNDAGDPCGYTVYATGVVPTTTGTQECSLKYFRWTATPVTTLTYIGVKYFKAILGGSAIVDCDPIAYSGQPMAKYYRIVPDALGFGTPIILYDTDPVDGKGYMYYMTNGTRHKLYYYQPSTFANVAPPGTYLEVKKVANIAEKRPSPTYIYYAGTDVDVPTNYYRYKEGSTLGTLNDDFTYVQFTDTPQETSYIDIYGIGVTENPQEVNQISLSGFRDLEIGSRLVLYKENIVWFSDLYQFDYIPNYNYIILPLTPDDRITSINYFKGSYIIFTKERIYKMSGTFGTNDFQVQVINDAIGCISPYSVKPFNNTLVFMTRDGLYRVKQNYYSGGLENVEKIDKQLDNITPYNREVYSVLYNEQFLLFYKYTNTGDFSTAPFNVLKMYYNMDAPRGYPYVKDKHAIQPPIIAKFDEFLYSIRNGEFYRYDLGYTDFLPSGTITDEVKDASLYTTKIRTHKISFGYPTHEKKFKSIIIKDIATEPVPLIFRIFVNNFLAYTSEEFVTSVNEFGQIEYNLVTDPFLIGPDNLMGEFDLGIDQLGDLSARVHKIVFSGRGKDILIDIERRTAQQFSIQDIGYVYKMGKAREDR